jgi:hypothetical protein
LHTILIGKQKLFIFNTIEQLVLENDLNALTSINLSNLKNGTYLYKIVKGSSIIKADKLIISK